MGIQLRTLSSYSHCLCTAIRRIYCWPYEELRSRNMKCLCKLMAQRIQTLPRTLTWIKIPKTCYIYNVHWNLKKQFRLYLVFDVEIYPKPGPTLWKVRIKNVICVSWSEYWKYRVNCHWKYLHLRHIRKAKDTCSCSFK